MFRLLWQEIPLGIKYEGHNSPINQKNGRPAVGSMRSFAGVHALVPEDHPYRTIGNEIPKAGLPSAGP